MWWVEQLWDLRHDGGRLAYLSLDRVEGGRFFETREEAEAVERERRQATGKTDRVVNAEGYKSRPEPDGALTAEELKARIG